MGSVIVNNPSSGRICNLCFQINSLSNLLTAFIKQKREIDRNLESKVVGENDHIREDKELFEMKRESN